MRVILIPLFAVSTVAAAGNGAEAPIDPRGQPSEALEQSAQAGSALSPITRKAFGLESKSLRDCRDKITQVREETGQPPLLDREPASPDNPYLIYAVDKRVDGCAVMVMKGNPADLRPLPKEANGPFVIMPLGSGR